jgi:hypothetical protein
MYKVDKVFRKVHRNRVAEDGIEVILGNKTGAAEFVMPMNQMLDMSMVQDNRSYNIPRNTTDPEQFVHEEAPAEEPDEQSVRIDYTSQETFGLMAMKKSISDTPSGDENVTNQYQLMKLTEYNPLKVPDGLLKKIRWFLLLPTKIIFFCLFPNMMHPPTDKKIGTVLFTYIVCTLGVFIPISILQCIMTSTYNIKPHVVTLFNGLIFTMK